MKTKATALVLAFFLLTLTSCGNVTAQSESELTASSETSSVSSTSEAETEPSSETPTEIAPSPILSQDELKAQIEAAADACAPVIDGFVIDIDEGMYPMPTEEEDAAMRDAIAALGYPVHGTDFDTPNYEKVEAFYADVEAKRDAQLLVFWLHNTGIQAEIFTARAGELTLDEAVSNFQAYDAPEQRGVVEFYNEAAIDTMRMTEDGWLRYSGTDDLNGEWSGGFRVQPLGDVNRELARKYLYYTAYYDGGIFSSNWDQEDQYMPYFENTYLYFYQMDYNEYPRRYVISSQDDGVSVQRVPSTDFEALMMKHLPFTREWYRQWGAYVAEEDAYIFGMEVPYSMSDAEVLSHKENADGSLTLTVSEIPVSGREGITHDLTVADNPDGSVRYISNVVHAEDE